MWLIFVAQDFGNGLHTVGVAGSNPASPTIFSSTYRTESTHRYSAVIEIVIIGSKSSDEIS